jgi:hypothetical protein
MDVIITSAQPNNVSITCDKPNIIYVVGAQPVNVTISFNIPNQSSSQSLKQTLLNGNETDGENILINDDDSIELENNSLLKKGTYDFGGNGGISRICGVGFEDMWQSGIRHVFDSNGFIRNSTNCFDIVPNETFDETLRFKVGSIWTLDDGSSYICTDASLGAAVWESFNLTATDIDALKRDGSNANQDIDLGVFSIKAREIVTQTNGSTKSMTLSSTNVTTERTAEWQDKDYTGIADLQDVVDAILALKDGVDLSGDTLKKLYNLILGATAEAYVADIAERDAYDIQRLPFSIFVIDDGDGKWAKYQATTTGVGAEFVKLSDPDLLNAVMSASAIKAAYESNSDTNAFTNALKTKLEGIDLSQYLLVSNISNILTGTSTTKALSEAQGKALKDLVDTKQQTITDVILAQIISSLNTKTTLANNDSFPINDTGAGTPPAKRVSFTSLKAFLKTYFDTLYQNSLGFNAENIANKQNSLAADGSGVKYPTVDAVNSGLSNVNTNSIRKDTVKLSQAINKGQAVYVSSANGTNLIVSKASNTSEETSSKTIGLLETTGAINDIVNVVTDGLLTGLNTSIATIGDPVWLGVNGDLIYGLTNKPFAPAHLVYIGIVTRVNANNGEILIKVQNGYELKEIHDVDLKTTTPLNNQVLTYESSTQLWKNKTIIEDSITNGVTTIAPSQNAVFDALALKQAALSYTPYRNLQTSQTGFTGSTAETILFTATIPAGTFNANDVIHFLFNVYKTTTLGSYVLRLKINTTNTLLGAATIGTYNGANTTQIALMNRNLHLFGGNLYGYPSVSLTLISDIVGSVGTIARNTLNPANQFFIFGTVTLANASDNIIGTMFKISN